MKKLIFSTLLSTIVTFGANAAEQVNDVQQAPATKRVSSLIVELPSELPNAVMNISVPGETQPQTFYNVKSGDVLNLTVPLSTSLERYTTNANFPLFHRPSSENHWPSNEPNIHAIMLEDGNNKESASFYVEGPIFHQDSYTKTGNSIFDDITLAKDTTSTMKLVIRQSMGMMPTYRVFSEIVS